MMLIAGTVPILDLPLITGEVCSEGKDLVVDGHRIPCTQGTGALITAALATTNYLKLDPPYVLVAGDIGKGEGSRLIYEHLAQNMERICPDVLVLHYILPDMPQMRKVCEAAEHCAQKPIMIADASSMYVAKAAGIASKFDIFTPDATEMAFLADPVATHPAYIARHLFDTDVSRTPELVATAYDLKSAAGLLLVKGSTDYIVRDGEILDTVTEPDVPVLEAIGGTGDTITGLVSALVYAELEPHEAAIIAARANRMAGRFAKATPATKIWQVIEQFPAVFAEHLCAWSGACIIQS